MPYNPRTWLDRVVEFELRFKDQNGDTWILTPDPGTITEVGTPLAAAFMNQIEQGIKAAADTADGALQRSGGTMTGDLMISKASPRIDLAKVSGTDNIVGIRFRDGTTITGAVYQNVSNGVLYFYDGAELRVIWHAGNDGIHSGLEADIAFRMPRYGNDGLASGAYRFGPVMGTLPGLGPSASYYVGYQVDGVWYKLKASDSDTVNGIQFRTTNGHVEWLDGSTWKGAGGVKVVRRGSIAISGAGNIDVTIPATDITKAWVKLDTQYLRVLSGGSSTVNLSIYLLNSTTIRLEVIGTDYPASVRYELVESY